MVDEGMREKEKTEEGKEKEGWSERVTEKGRECSSLQDFSRAVIPCSKSFLLSNTSCAVANGSQSH